MRNGNVAIRDVLATELPQARRVFVEAAGAHPVQTSRFFAREWLNGLATSENKNTHVRLFWFHEERVGWCLELSAALDEETPEDRMHALKALGYTEDPITREGRLSAERGY